MLFWHTENRGIPPSNPSARIRQHLQIPHSYGRMGLAVPYKRPPQTNNASEAGLKTPPGSDRYLMA